ncbi:MAG: signal peptide peptidase SppA [Bacteroidales bacterium]
MKQFFKFMFASMLGFFLASLVILFILSGMIAAMVSLSGRETVEVNPESILHLKLNTEIVDRGGASPFESLNVFSMGLTQPIGLNDLLKDIRKAKNDENIEGILLDVTSMRAGLATVFEVRRALEDFKTSGKFVISYGEFFSQTGYYLSSIADKVYLHPEGVVDFRGINSEIMFFSDMLDKLGIEPQVIRYGKFKSAVEPFLLEQMSPENRRQTLAFSSSIWNNVLDNISNTRGLSVNHLNEVANGLKTRTAQLAMETEMIDGLLYQDELQEELRMRIGKEDIEDLELIPYRKYQLAPGDARERQITGRQKIAVVYGSGNIMSGEGNEMIMGSDRIAAALREARLDESVKAIVFRVNSPGGSALASDVILREVKLAAEQKPVIASLGDVAASGGYYVVCGADKIFASPNTITGSIGVFGIIPNMKEFFNDKIGITFDNVKTNDFADLGTITRPMTRTERDMMQDMIDQVYQTFITHVSQGRDMPVSRVDSLGQGRVYSGSEALRNGLIDEFGGMREAIEEAAQMAQLDDYRVVEYPSRKDLLTRLMDDFGGMQEAMIKKKLGQTYIYYERANQVKEMTGIQLRMPFTIIMN